MLKLEKHVSSAMPHPTKMVQRSRLSSLMHMCQHFRLNILGRIWKGREELPIRTEKTELYFSDISNLMGADIFSWILRGHGTCLWDGDICTSAGYSHLT